MIKPTGYDEVTAINYDNYDENGNLPSGGYVIKFTKVEHDESGQLLHYYYDVAEGIKVNFFTTKYKRCNYWGGQGFRSYKGGALPYFKQFAFAVENSNLGYTWEWDEQSLVGKKVGAVIGIEEYKKRDGTINTRNYVVRILPIRNIRYRNFKVPLLKKLNNSSNKQFNCIPKDERQFAEVLEDNEIDEIAFF